MQTTTAIDAVRGETNIYDLDADVAIDASDTLFFKAYHKKGDTPVISKTRSDMNVTNASQGQFQVILDPADTLNLTVENTLGEVVLTRALIYEVQMDVGGNGSPQMIATGVMYLVG